MVVSTSRKRHHCTRLLTVWLLGRSCWHTSCSSSSSIGDGSVAVLDDAMQNQAETHWNESASFPQALATGTNDDIDIEKKNANNNNNRSSSNSNNSNNNHNNYDNNNNNSSRLDVDVDDGNVLPHNDDMPTTTHGTMHPGETMTETPRRGSRLRAWLDGLTIELPAVEILPSRLGMAVRMKGGVCKALSVASVDIKQAAGTKQQLRAEAAFSGLGFSCDILASAKVLGIWSDCGTHAVATSSSLDVGVTVAADDDGLPIGTGPSPLTITCEATLPLQELTFGSESMACRALSAMEGEIRKLVSRYASKLCETGISLMQPVLAQLLDKASANARPYLVQAPALQAPQGLPLRTVDLQKEFWNAPLGSTLREFMREVGHVDDPIKFNAVISYILKDLNFIDEEGHLILPQRIRDFLRHSQIEVPIPFSHGSFVASASVLDLAASNISSFGVLDLSMPGPQSARARGSVSPQGSVNLTAGLLLPEGGRASLDLGDGKVINITETSRLLPVNISLGAHIQAEGSMMGFLALDRDGLENHQMDQMMRLRCLEWITVGGISGGPVQLLEFDAMLIPSSMKVSFLDLPPGSLEEQLFAAVIRTAEAGAETFGPAFFHLLSGLTSGPGRDLFNSVTLEYLSSPHPCPASNYSSGTIEVVEEPMWVMSYGSLALCAISLGILACGAGGVWRRTSGSLQGSEVEAAEAGNRGDARTVRGEGSQLAAPALDPQLGSRALLLNADPAAPHRPNGQVSTLSKTVPKAFCYAVVFGIVGTICLFVVASVTPGVEIQVQFVDSMGQIWNTPYVAELSLDNSVGGMITSGAYFIAVLAILFSLIWPYVKLFGMLYVWLAPMTTKFRGRILEFLDQIGKWSLTDNFIMFLTIVLFAVKWQGAESSFGLQCLPAVELNVFVAATVLSLVLGHTMLAVHRWNEDEIVHAAVEQEAAERAVGAVRRVPLCRKLVLKKGSMGALQAPSKFGALATLLAIIAVTALLVVTFFVDIVEIQMDGLVGTFKDVTDQPRIERYSLWKVADLLGNRGSTYLQVVFVFFTVVLPCMHMLAFLLLWACPLSARKQLGVFALCQTIGAWASLDVFVIAYLGAVLGGEKYGIAQFLELVVYNQNTGPLCQGLRSIGVECLIVRIVMLEYAAVPVFTVIAMAALTVFVSRRVRRVFPSGEKPPSCEVRPPSLIA